MRKHDRPQPSQQEPAIITVSPRRAWSISMVTENGTELVELRQLQRHGDGRLSRTSHRSCFRPDSLPHFIAAFARIVAEGRR